MERLTLKIDGMSCGHCVRAVSAALQRVRGVKVERVDVGIATVEYDPAAATPEALARAVADAGYSVRPAA